MFSYRDVGTPIVIEISDDDIPGHRAHRKCTHDFSAVFVENMDDVLLALASVSRDDDLASGSSIQDPPDRNAIRCRQRC